MVPRQYSMVWMLWYTNNFPMGTWKGQWTTNHTHMYSSTYISSPCSPPPPLGGAFMLFAPCLDAPCFRSAPSSLAPPFLHILFNFIFWVKLYTYYTVYICPYMAQNVEQTVRMWSSGLVGFDVPNLDLEQADDILCQKRGFPYKDLLIWWW